MFDGEFEDDAPSGFGVKSDKHGQLLDCGRWSRGQLVESRPVPWTKVVVLPRFIKWGECSRAGGTSCSWLQPRWHCRIADARAHSSILVAVWLAMTAQAIPAEQRHRLLLLPSGNCFVGDFNAEFKAHGRGTEFRPNGSEAASGQWRDGRLHGCGKQNNPEASRSEGNFVDGHYSGVGTFTWLQGTVYEGDLAEGKRSGLGMLWSRDSALLLCGRWEDDRLVEERPVPRNKISIGTHLSAAGTSSTARQARQQQSAAQQR